MELTKEQQEIISAEGNIVINAVAGSGKTTTVIEYAKSRPAQSRILYLAFNRSVKDEAARRFAAVNLDNVTVETAHSLAYRYIVRQSNYKVHKGYKPYEIAEILKIQGGSEPHLELIIANHVNRFVSYFCNSDKQKVQELDYRETVSDSKARSFVDSHYALIERKTREFLALMDQGKAEITHDFYLKKFQLSNLELPFDYILFDEGQDASGAMLDVFLRQKAVKVIVGDTNQQIYGWRYAVNSLSKVNFNIYHLGTSFRFGEQIAALAMEVLKLKEMLGPHQPIAITGAGAGSKIKTKAVIARTNLGLLLKAIRYSTESKKIKKIYFEGNINSYTYADDGASLYDVLNLYTGQKARVRDPLISKMKTMYDLKSYVEKTEDRQTAMLIEIVEEYGREIPGLISKIKDRHVENREEADMIFTTVHRSKGMEYDAIELADDFVTEEVIEKALARKPQKQELARLNEEINLLYVAVTRTRNSIHLPSAILPETVDSGELIYLSDEIPMNSEEPAKNKEKTYNVEELRKTNKGAYMPWTPELDEELTIMFCEGESIKTLAVHFARTEGAIRSRIKKLELEELYG